MDWHFDNTYVRELPWLGAAMQPIAVAQPRIIYVGEQLAHELRLDPAWLASEAGAQVVAGSAVPEGAEPISQAYAGHQFGYFSPRLGDGRAHLLGEVVDVEGRRRDIALKGSGRTVFSRGGDGRAAIGPILREVLVSEAMAAIGVRTTRALAAAETGEHVWRDGRPERGAVLMRVADSHLRVGTLELVRTQGSREQLAALVDYSRRRHYPEIAADDVWGLFDAIAERQAELIAHWMSLGFIHGVMNTDNMALSGETIDYGPCAFLDHYAPETVYSSIDTGGRYRYSAQPTIAGWNLARLAESLLPLAVEPGLTEAPDEVVEEATTRVGDFEDRYAAAFRRRMAAKLGLPAGVDGETADVLIAGLLRVMERESLDFTGTFRVLAKTLRGETPAEGAAGPDPGRTKTFLLSRSGTAEKESGEPVAGGESDSGRTRTFLLSRSGTAEKKPGETGADSEAAARGTALAEWVEGWQAALLRVGADPEETARRMDEVNPAYIPRNHLVEEALDAAREGDLMPFEELLEVLRHPFEERPEWSRYAEPAPERFTATYVTFCGT